MNKILTLNESIEIAKKLKKQGKTIVVVGGFFDILHLGHIKFLEASKKLGDTLFVLLEEDSKAKKEKGAGRPINPQDDRAKVLSAIQNVDFVVTLKNMTNNYLYDKLMVEMRPNVIAVTSGDLNIIHKKRQAKLVKAKVVCAIKRISDHSTTKYTKLMSI
jgi:rfaE bifunctional protein nucleotidyltransferase chain/domain